MIRIVIAEDSNLVRSGIKAILAHVEDFEVVGEADNGIEAVQTVKTTAPDIVLMDIGLPQLNGIDATNQIKSSGVHTQVAMFTAYNGNDEVFHAFRAGADGYITKGEFTSLKLEAAVRALHKGFVWLDPVIAQHALQAGAAAARVRDFPGNHCVDKVEPFTVEELSLLKSVAGKTDDPDGGICKVEPGFLQKLSRFGRK